MQGQPNISKMKILVFILAALMARTTLQATPIRDLQHELGLEDSSWKLTDESDTSLSWITSKGIGITLTINGGANPKFPSPYDTKNMRDSYRREARSYHGDLVEAEPRKTNGVFFNLVTMKFPIGSLHTPPDDALGFAYQMNAIIPTAKACYVLQVGTMESQPTGMREAIGIIVYMKEKGIADLAVAAKIFNKDPYDPAYNKGAMFSVSDERRFDKSFPTQALSQCRAEMDLLLNSWTISDRIRKMALFTEENSPGKPVQPTP